MIPLIYLLFLAHLRRAPTTLPYDIRNRLVLISITGLCLFLSTAWAPNWIRLVAISPPAWILLAWFIHQPSRLNAAVRPVMWGGTVLWMIATPRTMQRMPVWYLDAPVGRTAFGDPVRYEKYQWLMERTRPGDFFYGSFYPDSYYSLDLRNPADTPYITPNDYTRPEQVENVVQALERHQVRFVLWAWSLDAPRPNLWSHDNLPPLRAYLRRHYHVASTFSDGDQILERNP